MTQKEGDTNKTGASQTQADLLAALRGALTPPPPSTEKPTPLAAPQLPQRTNRPIASFTDSPLITPAPPAELGVLQARGRVIKNSDGSETTVVGAVDQLGQTFSNAIFHREELRRQKEHKSDVRGKVFEYRLNRHKVLINRELINRRNSADPRSLTRPMGEAFQHLARPTMAAADTGIVPHLNPEQAWNWTVNAAKSRKDLVSLVRNISEKTPDPDARTLGYVAIEQAAQEKLEEAVGNAYEKAVRTQMRMPLQISLDSSQTRRFIPKPLSEILHTVSEDERVAKLGQILTKIVSDKPSFDRLTDMLASSDPIQVTKAVRILKDTISLNSNGLARQAHIEDAIANYCAQNKVPETERPILTDALQNLIRFATVPSADDPHTTKVRDEIQTAIQTATNELVSVVQAVSEDQPNDEALKHLRRQGNPIARLRRDATPQEARAQVLEAVLPIEDGVVNHMIGTVIFGGFPTIASLHPSTKPRIKSPDRLIKAVESKLTPGKDLAPLSVALNDEFTLTNKESRTPDGKLEQKVGLNLFSKAMLKQLAAISPDAVAKTIQQLALEGNEFELAQLIDVLDHNLSDANARSRIDPDEFAIFVTQTASQALNHDPIPGISPDLPRVLATHAGKTIARGMSFINAKGSDQKTVEGAITAKEAGVVAVRLGDSLLKQLPLPTLDAAAKPMFSEEIKFSGRDRVRHGVVRDLNVAPLANPHVRSDLPTFSKYTRRVGFSLAAIANEALPSPTELAGILASRTQRTYATEATKLTDFIKPPGTVYDEGTLPAVLYDMLIPLPDNQLLFPSQEIKVTVQAQNITPGPLSSLQNPAYLGSVNRYAPQIEKTGMGLQQHLPLSRQEAAAAMTAIIIGNTASELARRNQAYITAGTQKEEWGEIQDHRKGDDDVFTKAELQEAAVISAQALTEAMQAAKDYREVASTAVAFCRQLCGEVGLNINVDTDSGSIAFSRKAALDPQIEEANRRLLDAVTQNASDDEDADAPTKALHNIRLNARKLGVVNAIAQEFALTPEGRSVYNHTNEELEALAVTISALAAANLSTQ